MMHSEKSNSHRDPVCGMTVSAENTAFTLERDSHTYYFCAKACRDAFEKSPGTYVAQPKFFLARWWNNYLKRLNKITNGKSQCCH